jgi:hypothetical protein
MVADSKRATSYKEVFEEIGATPVAFYLVLAELCGSLHAGLMLSQALYWNDRSTLADGWFYKSTKEWRKELYLSKAQQKTARKILVSRGFMSERKRGLPCTMHFRVESDRVFAALRQLAGKWQTGVRKTGKQVGKKVANRFAEKQQTFHIQTETTTKTTALGAPDGAGHFLLECEEKEQRQNPSNRTAAQYTPNAAVAEYLKSVPGGNPWKPISRHMARTFDIERFDTWMRPCQFDGVEGNVLVLTVPNAISAEMCACSHKQIMAAIDELKIPFSDVRFFVRSYEGGA